MSGPFSDETPELARRVAAWIEGVVGPGALVRRARRLPRASTSSVHAVDVATRAGRLSRLVLRRYVDPAVLESEPGAVEREAVVLTALEPTPVAAPRVVAIDPLGEQCGVPAVLMTRLPGRPRPLARHLEGFVDGLAAALPAVHAIILPTPPSFPGYHCYHHRAEPAPPHWSRDRHAWEVAIERHRAAHPAVGDGLIHRDYHPGNVLWRDGVVSGTVDWAWSCRGPRLVDVAHCRANLAMTHGSDVADDFLDAWRSVAGVGDYDPAWDLVDAVDFLPDLPVSPTARRRLDGFVTRAVAELA